MTQYLITFSSGKPFWNHSKWKVSAETRSQALHKANLMHDKNHSWETNMITISKIGSTDAEISDFTDLDTSENQRQVEILDRIWQQKFNILEDC